MLSNNPEGPSQAQQAILSLGDAGREVAAEVRADRVARKRHDRSVLALLVVVALAVGAVAWFGYSSYQLNNTVADCTTPGGKCYEATKAQYAVNRSELTRANLFIVDCATSGSTGVKLRACVERKLTEAGIDIALLTDSVLPSPSAPSGPPADVSIAPGGPDQPVEPSPVHPPNTDDPADPAGETGGTTP